MTDDGSNRPNITDIDRRVYRVGPGQKCRPFGPVSNLERVLNIRVNVGPYPLATRRQRSAQRTRTTHMLRSASVRSPSVHRYLYHHPVVLGKGRAKVAAATRAPDAGPAGPPARIPRGLLYLGKVQADPVKLGVR
jgi:hypothetical protein